jgi:hypothetical protein
MNETITASYDTVAKARNAVDDLVAVGIPAEKVFLDEERIEVKVIAPKTAEPEITEILQRHQPEKVAT